MTAEGLALCKVLGVAVAAEPLERCVERILEAIDGDGPTFTFMCANPHSLFTAGRDPELLRALRSADLVVPDGIGVVAASRLLALRGAVTIPQRVTGSDIFHGVSTALSRRGGARCFFLGTTDQTLERVAERLVVDYPGLEVSGLFAPPFKSEFDEEDDREMIEAIAASRSDVLWVGLTAPKQECWIARNVDRLPVRFAGAVGALFDFFAGTVPRPHPLLQRLGLEWAGRLASDPRRMWRRTAISTPGFLFEVGRQLMSLPKP